MDRQPPVAGQWLLLHGGQHKEGKMDSSKMYYQVLNNEPVAPLKVNKDYKEPDTGIRRPYQAIESMTDAERAAIGVYPYVEDAMPDRSQYTFAENDLAFDGTSVVVSFTTTPIDPAVIASNAAQAEIYRLEGTIQPRWVRNAAMGDAYAIGKIQEVEALLDVERAKL